MSEGLISKTFKAKWGVHCFVTFVTRNRRNQAFSGYSYCFYNFQGNSWIAENAWFLQFLAIHKIWKSEMCVTSLMDDPKSRSIYLIFGKHCFFSSVLHDLRCGSKFSQEMRNFSSREDFYVGQGRILEFNFMLGQKKTWYTLRPIWLSLMR